MVTRVLGIALAGILTAAGAAAQEQPPVPPANPPSNPAPPPATTPPATPAKEALPQVAAAPPIVPSQPPPLAEQALRDRRKHISMMEGMFIGAVKSAANDISERMQASGIPGLNQMSGSLTARGWNLDGYGVFFAVEIPGVVPSVATVAQLQLLRERMGGASQPQALRTADSAATTPVINPDAEYVELVKNALIDAMVDYSKPLELQPQEWLTVAAGDGDEPLNPAFLVQRSTLILRVRGSDIADYLSGRLSKDAVRQKVEVRRF